MAGTDVTTHQRVASTWHHGSHRHLLTPSTPHPMDVDAIIVPTGRNAAKMRSAMAVAEELKCTLVALCSKWSSAADVAGMTAAKNVKLITIDASTFPPGMLPAFQTCELLAGTRFERKTDTSAKRNFGLLLAKLIGWNKVVFLDDDIDLPDPQQLRDAAGLTSYYAGVGLNIDGMPDNSVVCHAWRESGGAQDMFVGGGALAVAVNSTSSFFPNIYNEDWFFLLGDDDLQRTTLTGTAKQQAYDPFASEDRARREEFGDTLAEGLFWLLDNGKSLTDADFGHWAEYIERRRGFIAEVTAMVQRVEPEDRRARMLASLKAARGRSEVITPEMCVQYVEAWRADRFTWRRHVQEVYRTQVTKKRKEHRNRRTVPEVHALLQSLGLAETRFHLSLPKRLDHDPADFFGPAGAVG